ncbi:hypothetical protein [Desulfuromonas thiophila]|uniref:hypothetical protein n=1 Tax=Desulfuromonas thiophila TaxID=57664 RepID=UPI001495B59D|nr:hypothetical protein [Desulfuromonas thiophila]
MRRYAVLVAAQKFLNGNTAFIVTLLVSLKICFTVWHVCGADGLAIPRIFPDFLLDWIVDEEARQGPFPLAAAGRNPCLSE